MEHGEALNLASFPPDHSRCLRDQYTWSCTLCAGLPCGTTAVWLPQCWERGGAGTECYHTPVQWA